MESAGSGTARFLAFDSARAATYLVELLLVTALYVGAAESARLFPAINQSYFSAVGLRTVANR